jgi:hypothetical protein
MRKLVSADSTKVTSYLFYKEISSKEVSPKCFSGKDVTLKPVRFITNLEVMLPNTLSTIISVVASA